MGGDIAKQLPQVCVMVSCLCHPCVYVCVILATGGVSSTHNNKEASNQPRLM